MARVPPKLTVAVIVGGRVVAAGMVMLLLVMMMVITTMVGVLAMQLVHDNGALHPARIGRLVRRGALHLPRARAVGVRHVTVLAGGRAALGAAQVAGRLVSRVHARAVRVRRRAARGARHAMPLMAVGVPIMPATALHN